MLKFSTCPVKKMGEEGEKKRNGLWVKTVGFDLLYGA